MRDWQDWNGDGKVDNSERAFTTYMINDMNKRAKNNGGGCLSCILLFLVIMAGVFGLAACASPAETNQVPDEKAMEKVVSLLKHEKYEEASRAMIGLSVIDYPDIEVLDYYIEYKLNEKEGKASGARADMLKYYMPSDYDGVMKEEIKAYREYYIERYSGKSQEEVQRMLWGENEEEDLEAETEEEEKDDSEESESVSGGILPDVDSNKGNSRKPTYSSDENEKEYPDDPYDVYEYSDPEDFYYDNYDEFDEYGDAEVYFDEAWDE